MLQSVFLTKSFSTALVNLAKSTGAVFNLSTSILSISVFNAAKLVLDAKLQTFTCVIFLTSSFVAKSNSTLILLELQYGGKY